MNNVLLHISAALLVALAALHGAGAHASLDTRAFGATWQSAAAVPDDQAQVIYYRAAAPDAENAALLYIDNQFHAALLPGMFSQFCLAPGSHTLGAWRGEAPLYQGKSDSGFQATLKGGKTYFVRVDETVNGRPQAVKRSDAERELKTLRAQQHTLSRAAAVQACRPATPLLTH